MRSMQRSRTSDSGRLIDGQSEKSSGTRSQTNMGVTTADAWLFDTPADLLCPITHSIFKDPVINAAGQVYERAAIEQHLSLRGTDPITNAPLASAQLIPVYTLKSRSYEFREHVAKACVDKAYSTRSCEGAVRYLRRAAELVSGLGSSLKVPGLCQEVVEFLQSHPSNAYNSIALRIFADGLRQAGYVDQAMQLYLRLVEWCGEDPAQQAAALRQCLVCFGHADGDPGDRAVLPFLAQFLETQQTFSAAQVLDLLQEARVPEPLVLQLCEHLLLRRARPNGAAGDGTGHGPQVGLQYQDLLLQYTQLKFRTVQRQIDSLQAADSSKEQPQANKLSKSSSKVAGPRGDATGGKGPAGANGADCKTGQGSICEDQGGDEQRTGRLRGAAGFVKRRQRVLASCAVAALALLDGRRLAMRLLQAGGVIALVHTKPHS